jgi:membrane protease YdiL (CAAX protease family)
MLSSPVAHGFALFLLVGLPLMAARNSRLEEHLEVIERARPALYFSAALTLLLVAGLTAIVAAWQGIAPADLGWRVEAPGLGVAVGAAVAAVGLLVAWLSGVLGRLAGLKESPLLRLLLPGDSRERRAFLVLAGIGAVCEEYVYRGFALHVLSDWTGQPWAAAGITAASFGLAHGYQRLNGIIRSAMLGMVLAAPVIWTGSLFPAILGHFWINAAMASGVSSWIMVEADEPAVADEPTSPSAEDE